MSYRKHLMASDEPPSELYKAVELGTNLAEVGMDCISRQAAIDAVGSMLRRKFGIGGDLAEITLAGLPPAQPETAKRIVGKSKDGMTLWYQCDMCNEPVDAQDNFCRECGRRLIDE